MNFLNPSAFWLSFLIIVPIIIHLFQFRRYKKVYFSANQFLLQANEKQKRSRRLKHLLILFSRILFILFFVIFLCKPVIESEQRNNVFNTVVVDNTPSNTAIAEGKNTSILEENQGFITALEADYKEKISVLNTGGEKINSSTPIEIDYTKSTVKLNEDWFQPNSYNLILSDFQSSLIDDNLELFSDSSYAFTLFPAYQNKPLNVYVDSVWVEKNEESNASLLKCIIKANANTTDISVQLKMNNQLLGSNTVDFTESLQKSLEYQINDLNSDADFLDLRIELNDPVVGFDNTFYLSFSKENEKSVLILNQNTSIKSLKAVFEDNELFNLSLSSLGNYNFELLNEHDFVIAIINGNFSTFARESLQSYAQNGGTLFLIPGEKFQSTEAIRNFGFPEASFLADRPSPLIVETPDYSNPFFRNVFTKKEQQVNMPSAKPLLKWENTEDLLSFRNNYPFLSRSILFKGVYLLSSPLNSERTNLEKHGLFLPLLYKMVFSNSTENAVSFHYLDERVISLNIPDLPEKPIIKLVKDNITIIPDQRFNGNQLTVILPETGLQPGFYELIDTENGNLYDKLALNTPKEESESEFYTIDELTELFADNENITILPEYNMTALSDYVEETKEGFPLWKYFLVLALLCLLAEVLLIRFFR